MTSDSTDREIEATDKRKLRTALKAKIPPSWFTKRHTRGVVSNYKSVLEEMQEHSRRWAVHFFGAP